MLVLILLGYAVMFGSKEEIPLLLCVAAVWVTINFAFIRPPRALGTTLFSRQSLAYGGRLVRNSFLSFAMRGLPIAVLLAVVYGCFYLVGVFNDTVQYYIHHPNTTAQFLLIAAAIIATFVSNKTNLGLAEQYGMIAGLGAVVYSFMAFGWKFGVVVLILAFITHWFAPRQFSRNRFP